MNVSRCSFGLGVSHVVLNCGNWFNKLLTHSDGSLSCCHVVSTINGLIHVTDYVENLKSSTMQKYGMKIWVGRHMTCCMCCLTRIGTIQMLMDVSTLLMFLVVKIFYVLLIDVRSISEFASLSRQFIYVLFWRSLLFRANIMSISQFSPLFKHYMYVPLILLFPAISTSIMPLFRQYMYVSLQENFVISRHCLGI